MLWILQYIWPSQSSVSWDALPPYNNKHNEGAYDIEDASPSSNNLRRAPSLTGQHCTMWSLWGHIFIRIHNTCACMTMWPSGATSFNVVTPMEPHHIVIKSLISLLLQGCSSSEATLFQDCRYMRLPSSTPPLQGFMVLSQCWANNILVPGANSGS